MNSTERFKVVMDILDGAGLCNNTINHRIFDNLRDSELTDEAKVKDIIGRIEGYNSKIETNASRYPEKIMQVLRQRNGLEFYDTSEDEALNTMSPSDVFSEVMQWNGFLGFWDETIKGWIREIYGIELE